ncbi:MafI family immunity protein [Streptomyces sp. NPDC053427]|uniref:MafI family immunity protein n=1 Tax=Streptomyces sp. NPDC053427 TaxID=3365701 RepID=UPI0037CE7ED3
MAELLADSPLTSEAVITDVRPLIQHGEEALAFDTTRSWISEDDLPITRQYHGRLVALVAEMAPESVQV